MGELTVRNWRKYRIRRCHTRHSCHLCALPIRFLDPYYDGGTGRRAHTICVVDLERRIGRRVDEKAS